MSFFNLTDPSASNAEMIKARQRQLQDTWKRLSCQHLFSVDDELSKANQHNCENMIGAVAVPVGLAGPVKIMASISLVDECFVPLATSEGALVASVNRGLKAINQAGGASVIVENVGMTRAPVFALASGQAAFAFAKFLEDEATLATIIKITESTSKHLHFIKLQSFVRGRNVYVRFNFHTEEAMGMNMVTIALQKLWEDFLSHYSDHDSKIEMLAISSNVCTDKKASFINQLLGRGYMTQAEVWLSEAVLQSTLKTTIKALLRTHQSKNLHGSNLAGSPASNMQFANVVVAFLLATGQDVAHVAEASQGSTIIEEVTLANGEQGVYCAVNLPDLPLASVGGGTNLPSQKELRALICKNSDSPSAKQLASVLATGVLAAEISGLAALSNNSLSAAHQRLGR